MESIIIKQETPTILEENALFYSNYESSSTSLNAETQHMDNTSLTVENTDVCVWSQHNKKYHMLSGLKGSISLTATFTGIHDDVLVDEYITRVVLIRTNPQHKLYPIETVCSKHKQNTENSDQVLQAKPGTPEETFWYTNNGPRKSIVFKTSKPNQGVITVQINLISTCFDTCDVQNEYFQRLVNISGKEKSRDMCIVVSLEARKLNDLITIGRGNINVWMKAKISHTDLLKERRREPKGGAAQNKIKRQDAWKKHTRALKILLSTGIINKFQIDNEIYS